MRRQDCVSDLITRLVKKSNLDYGVAGRGGNAERHIPVPWLSFPGTPCGSPHLSAPLHGLSSEGDRITTAAHRFVLPVGARSLASERQAGKKAHVN